MNRWILALFLAIIVFVSWQLWRVREAALGSQLQIGQAVVAIEIRDTPAGRSIGLSGRESLEENEGVLFIFEEPDQYQFWMLDMNFDLDFVWINEGLVVDISEHIPAPDKLTNEPPMTVRPSQPATWILEVNSGWVEANGIRVGDQAQLL
jgi:hypothetical protein